MADSEENITFDAQRTSEDVNKGEQKLPKVNVESDYERSKEFAVADIDKTGEGAKAAESATGSFGGQSESSGASGDPEAFRKMAAEVKPDAEA